MPFSFCFRGVLSVAWCNEDPDLLISCGKDNKLLVWNPNTDAQVMNRTSLFVFDYVFRLMLRKNF